MALPDALDTAAFKSCAFAQEGGLARALTGATRLRSLRLNDVRGVGALAEVPMRSLRVIMFACGTVDRPGGPHSLVQSLRGVRGGPAVLQLQGNSGFSDLGALAPALRSVRVLDLSNCDALRSLEPLGSCTALEYLDVSGARQLASFRGLQRGPRRTLRTLLALGCLALHDLYALRGMSELRELRLGGCGGVTDLGPLGDCPRLRHLSLAECAALTSVRGLRRCRALRELELWGVELPLSGMDALPRLDVMVAMPHADQQTLAREHADVVLDVPWELPQLPPAAQELAWQISPQDNSGEPPITAPPRCFCSRQGSFYREAEGGDGALAAANANGENGFQRMADAFGNHVGWLGPDGELHNTPHLHVHGVQRDVDEESSARSESESEGSLQSRLDDSDDDGVDQELNDFAAELARGRAMGLLHQFMQFQHQHEHMFEDDDEEDDDVY